MKAIIDFFKTCPVLLKQSVREDYLGPESGNVAIAPDGGEQKLKVYASGDMLGQICFKIMVRENFTGNASKIFEGISDWLAEQENLPILGGGKESQYLEISEGPALVKTDVNAGVFEMKLRLVYYRKGEKK